MRKLARLKQVNVIVEMLTRNVLIFCQRCKKTDIVASGNVLNVVKFS